MVAAVLIATPSALSAGRAAAADITFAVIGPHEYELPVNYDQPFNALVQYGEVNENSRNWNSSGHTSNGSGGSLYEGLTKYVYFFDFKALPNVGFAAEVIEPEVYVSDSTPHTSGLGGTIFGFAFWTKPNKFSTFGFQSFGQAPDSTGKLAVGEAWNNLSSFLFDYQFKHFDFGGDAGIVFRGTGNFPGNVKQDRSDLFHFNGRLGFKVHPVIEPFLALDWTSTNSSHDGYTGQEIIDSAFHETAIGAGANIAFSKKAGLTLRYSRGIDGRNTSVTNATYFKLYYVF